MNAVFSITGHEDKKYIGINGETFWIDTEQELTVGDVIHPKLSPTLSLQVLSKVSKNRYEVVFKSYDPHAYVPLIAFIYDFVIAPERPLITDLKVHELYDREFHLTKEQAELLSMGNVETTVDGIKRAFLPFVFEISGGRVHLRRLSEFQKDTEGIPQLTNNNEKQNEK